jgi:murein L,D-transpeptidase YafK
LPLVPRSIAAIPALGFLIAALCGASDACAANSRHLVPFTSQILAAMKEKRMRKEDPVLIRSYKQEGELEIWKKNKSGHYALLKIFPICRWSGQLGPKQKEGDGQAPEGFYAITPAQMNPNSNYHLAFNTGYPNAYDRAHGATGLYLMVHGNCLSVGCYAMSDQQIEEIYALVREAHTAGQKAVQMQAFPFRFTPQNLARHRRDTNTPSWENLQEGADRFDIAKDEPRVGVCDGRYTFDRVGDSAQNCGREANPDLARKVAEKRESDSAMVAALIAKGEPALAFIYENGGQNAYFRDKLSPELLIAAGPVIWPMDAKSATTTIVVRTAGGDEDSIAAAIRKINSLPATTVEQVATASPAPTPHPSASEQIVASTSDKPPDGVAAPPVAPSSPRKTASERHGDSTTVAVAVGSIIGLIVSLTALMRILRRRGTITDLKEEA